MARMIVANMSAEASHRNLNDFFVLVGALFILFAGVFVVGGASLPRGVLTIVGIVGGLGGLVVSEVARRQLGSRNKDVDSPPPGDS